MANRRFKTTLSVFAALMLFLSVSLSGCAYQFGYTQRVLPGGFKQVAIPMFENVSRQVGAEKYFTEALVREFHRSQVAQVITENHAPVTIVGKIVSINYNPDSLVQGGGNQTSNQNNFDLPNNTVLATIYRVVIKVHLKIVRNSDQKVIWQADFNDERSYNAPQIGLATINSADPLYNQSARNEVVEALADDMMHTAHDQMTENF